jgi:type IV pilus assembly protein PilB
MSSGASKRSIGELMVVEKMLTPAQLADAQREQRATGGRLTAALIKKGLLNETQLADFFAKQYSLPSLDLDQFEIDEEAIRSIPRDRCDKYMVMPVSRSGNTLVVAFSDPSNLSIKDDLQFITKCKVEMVVATETAIKKAIEKYMAAQKDEKKNLSALVDEMEVEADSISIGGGTAQALDGDLDSAPIIKFVNVILAEAIKTKTSDIHIEPYEKRLRVRFRIDGSLYEKVQPPPGVAAGLASRIKIMSKLDIAERRLPQDGRIKVKTGNGMEVDFRVSVLPTIFGEKIVMRTLDKSNLKLDMTKLGFEVDDLDVFKEAISQPQGLVLVTGPTGSGKTTTLYSALSHLNTPDVNIATAEDPVEYNLDGINQVQVNADIDFTFASALRSFLRQDPDIILVGEIRDLETAEIAFKASSTGHLVLSTLHTNDAPATISRLLDMGVAPFLITSTVSLVVAQRLVGKNCLNCRVPVEVDPEVLIRAGAKPEEVKDYKTMKGEGCAVCNGTGIKGRIAVYELMRMSGPLKEIVLKNGTPLEIKAGGIKGGMKTLRQSALLKVKSGETSLEQMLMSTVADDQSSVI